MSYEGNPSAKLGLPKEKRRGSVGRDTLLSGAREGQ